MALEQSTPSVPLRCCSPLLPSSPFPPLAYSFTFYAPLSTPAASFFYSQEPTNRTKIGIVSIEDEVWEGVKEGKEDETDKFIRDAMQFGGEQMEKDEIVIKGRAGTKTDEDLGESGKKRKRDESESSSSQGAEERGSVEKKSRMEEPGSSKHGTGRAKDDVEWPVKRNSRPSPSYEIIPPIGPTLPFRRLIDTSIVTAQSFVTTFDIDPYLTPDPMPASHSHRFFTTLLDFMAYVEPPSAWEMPKGKSVYARREASHLSRRIRDYSPNFQRIRNLVPLGVLAKVKGDAYDSVFGNTNVSSSVVAWIWGVWPSVSQLRWVVEKSPLPIFVLFLEYVLVARFIEAVEHAQRRFVEYLTNSSFLSHRAERAKVLVRWLGKTDRKNERWERFFDGDGRRGSQTWEWWFDDLGCERSEAELNEWERRQL